MARREDCHPRFARSGALNRLNTAGLWFVPYVAHAVVGLALGAGVGWLLGAAYFVGMMSHPVQGGIVNALGRAVGGRNFDTDDNSRNNHLAAWLILGEGFQNNHHRYPSSARFSYRAREIALGYALCVALEAVGLLSIDRVRLIGRPPARRR